MWRTVQFLLVASRSVAICAVLVGLGAGLLQATFGAAFICFDSCPDPTSYFSRLALGAVWLLTPCVAIETLALVLFLAYCAATGKPRCALAAALVFLLGGVAGYFALFAFIQQAQSSIAITRDGSFVEQSLETWTLQWGLAVTAVAAIWSGVLAYLQWPHNSELSQTFPSSSPSAP